MSKVFACPYLGRDVELTDEREQHIVDTHPGTLPDYLEQLKESLTNPDQIRQSEYDEAALLFSKWFDTIRIGCYLIVVIVTHTDSSRHWIVTIYTARKLSGGKVIWQKN